MASPAGLAEALAARQASTFIGSVADSLRGNPGSFPLLRTTLQQLLSETHASRAPWLDEFTLDCTEVALVDAAVSPALAHLILDTLIDLNEQERQAAAAAAGVDAGSDGAEGRADGAEAAAAAAHAARVLLRCCAEQPRLAVKVAQAFRLRSTHLTVAQQGELLDAISAMLDANATSASGVALLLHFRSLRHHFHLEAVLEDLVLSAQDPVATRFVRELGSTDMQELYVSLCLQYGQLRSANAAVKAFGLQQAFPDVERMHKAKQLDKMISKGLWGVAGQYVGADAQLQRTLLEAMLVAGELGLAQQHQQLFGLEGQFEIHPQRLAEEQERRRQQFLQLPLPPGAVHFVDSAAAMAAAGARLAALLEPPQRHGATHSSPAGGAPAAAAEPAAASTAGAPGGDGSSGGGAAAPADRTAELLPVLGMDLEWQPDSENSSPPSLLQLSTDSEVFVIDLLALAGPEGEAALTAALAPLLAAERVFKLGCGVSGDCKKLAGHHPGAFALVRGCLDLSTMWRTHTVEQSGKRSTLGFKKRAGEISLSVLAQSILGKPLDKSCQVSDWGRRPLSPQQLSYAALDAHAAVLIFRGMGQMHHPFCTRQGLARFVFTHDARQGHAARRGGGNGNGGGGPHGGSGGSSNHGSGGANGSSSNGSGGAGGGPAAAGGAAPRATAASALGSSSGGGMQRRHLNGSWGNASLDAASQRPMQSPPGAQRPACCCSSTATVQRHAALRLVPLLRLCLRRGAPLHLVRVSC